MLLCKYYKRTVEEYLLLYTWHIPHQFPWVQASLYFSSNNASIIDKLWNAHIKIFVHSKVIEIPLGWSQLNIFISRISYNVRVLTCRKVCQLSLPKVSTIRLHLYVLIQNISKHQCMFVMFLLGQNIHTSTWS